MRCTRFAGMTQILGMDQRFIPLPVRVDKPEDGPTTITSCWLLTSEEIAQLVAGGAVYLTVLGPSHPAVKLEIARHVPA